MKWSLFPIVAAVFLAAILLAPAAQAEVIILEPIQDNTLYDDTATPPDGSGGQLSNGAGPHFYAGLAGGLKRGLISFDLSAIPANATVTNVTLTMSMNRTHPLEVPSDVSLHRVLSAWGEGTSNAGGDPADPSAPGGGGGIAATSGDATWLHTFFDTSFWTTPGGDFAATPSATTSVVAVGSYTWTGVGMAMDVQDWLADPASNFGWIVIGNEAAAPSVKRFSSREADDPTVRPQVQVTFERTVTSIPTLGGVGFAVLMILLAAAAIVALRRRRLT